MLIDRQITSANFDPTGGFGVGRPCGASSANSHIFRTRQLYVLTLTPHLGYEQRNHAAVFAVKRVKLSVRSAHSRPPHPRPVRFLRPAANACGSLQVDLAAGPAQGYL